MHTINSYQIDIRIYSILHVNWLIYENFNQIIIIIIKKKKKKNNNNSIIHIIQINGLLIF